eukprot:400238_1
MGNFINTAVDRIIGKRQSIVLILGLENAGKSTLMDYFNKSLKNIPIGINVPDQLYQITAREFLGKTFIFTAIDIYGNIETDLGRLNLIKAYFNNIDALIWIIDSNDRQNFNLAYNEFKYILNEMSKLDEPLHQPIHNRCHILLLANKQDIPTAMSVNEIKCKMEMVRNIPIHESFFFEIRYKTMLKYLPNEIFEIIVEYLQCCVDNSPCINIKPMHFMHLNIELNNKILNIICEYLPCVAYNDDKYTAKYETLPCSTLTGNGLQHALQWIYQVVFKIDL